MNQKPGIYRNSSHLTQRGDRVTADYTTATLTLDGAAHDLDLSALLPPGTKALWVTIHLNGTGFFSMYPKGWNSGYCNAAIHSVGGYEAALTTLVACGTDRIYTYAGTGGGTLTTCSLHFRGFIK